MITAPLFQRFLEPEKKLYYFKLLYVTVIISVNIIFLYSKINKNKTIYMYIRYWIYNYRLG